MRTRPTAEVDLPAAAQILLDTAAAALGDAAPERRYRAAGFAVHDLAACGCDSQLTVCIAGAAPTGPGGRGTGVPTTSAQSLNGYTFTVELARSVPTFSDAGGAPSADDLDGSGAQHMADYRTLDLWIRSLGYDSKINADLKAAGVMQLAPSTLATVGPLGGVVAIRAGLVANL